MSAPDGMEQAHPETPGRVRRHRLLVRARHRAPLGVWDAALVLALLGAAALFAQRAWDAGGDLAAEQRLTRLQSALHREQVRSMTHIQSYTANPQKSGALDTQGVDLRVYTGAFGDRANYFSEACLGRLCSARTAAGELGWVRYQPITHDTAAPSLAPRFGADR